MQTITSKKDSPWAQSIWKVDSSAGLIEAFMLARSEKWKVPFRYGE